MTAADATDLVGSARAAFCLASGTRDENWATTSDEVAWYCLGRPGSARLPTAERQGHDIGGGIARAELVDTHMYLKAPAGHSHNHADASALAVQLPEGWLIGDPGTGTYNGDEQIRNYFRSSLAHNVLRINGLDQLEPHRAFRWKHRAVGAIIEPIAFDDGMVMSMWHGAYQRLETATTVLRAAVVYDGSIIVADFVSAPAPGRLAVTFGPGVNVHDDVARLGTRAFAFDLRQRYAPAADGVAGRWSDTYGAIQPTTRVEVDTPARSPIAWSLSTRPIAYEADGQTLRFEYGKISVQWRSEGAEMRVDFNDGRREVRSVNW